MENSTRYSTETSVGTYPRDRIFNPKSVAVLGVTQSPGTVPYDIFYNILSSGYKGVLYPVAPGKRSVSAVPAYRYLTDIEDDVDLAVIVFPAAVCDKALEMCGKKGVKGVIIISAGFREVGPEGLKREQRIKDICTEYGISLIGPNCLGVINTDPRILLNASFARKMPADGRIAFAGAYRGFGQIVIIEHVGGWTSLITGLARTRLKVGERIAQGDPIGRAADNRPRITVELRRNGRPIDIAALIS